MITRFRTRVMTILMLFAITSATAFLVVIPVTAHNPSWTIQTYVYLTAAPNPVSPGQRTNLQYWFNVQPATATSNTGYRWQNITIEITKPDGSIEHFTNLISDPSGQDTSHILPMSLENTKQL